MPVVGQIARYRPERLALVLPDGTPSNWFAQWQSLRDVRRIRCVVSGAAGTADLIAAMLATCAPMSGAYATGR